MTGYSLSELRSSALVQDDWKIGKKVEIDSLTHILY